MLKGIHFSHCYGSTADWYVSLDKIIGVFVHKEANNMDQNAPSRIHTMQETKWIFKEVLTKKLATNLVPYRFLLKTACSTNSPSSISFCMASLVVK